MYGGEFVNTPGEFGKIYIHHPRSPRSRGRVSIGVFGVFN